MSLLRLLTTGKSLVGVEDSESRYRVTRQRLLPQFGPARNPFMQHGRSGSRRRRRARPSANAARGRAGERRRTSAGAGGRAGDEGALRLRAAALLSGWKAKLGGLLCASARQGGEAGHPAVHEAAGARGAVVGQDQSGAKRLERRGPGSCSGQTTAAPAAAAARGKQCAVRKAALGRVTARIFGAGKT